MLLEKYNKMYKNNYAGPLDKYFKTKTMQRLKGKGLFCGMDYVGVEMLRPREYYSRYDHSRNIGYAAWTLSEDLKCALTASFHDIGTLSFAHANSFKKGDALNQENDELDVKSVLLKDEEILTYLNEDGIKLNDVIDATKYPLIDKEIPALCLDRVDGILATCLFWAKTHNFKQIKELYYMLCYFENLNGMNIDLSSERLVNFNGEIVINEHHVDANYEDFFTAINVYSKILLSKESRYMMELLGLVLKFYEDMKIINESQLFHFSEQANIDRMLDSKYKNIWLDFISVDKVEYAKPNQEGLLLYSKPKIRQANPLCMGQMEVCEIDCISGDFYRELNDLNQAIELVSQPLVGNLNNETAKVLSKYKK